AGARPTADLLDGVDTSWARVGGAAAAGYAQAIAEARRLLERDRPERALPALVRAHQELDQLSASLRAAARPGQAGAVDRLPDAPRVRDARRALADAIAAAAGLFARATAAQPVAAPGATVEVQVEIAARGAPVTVQRIELLGAPAITAPAALAAGQQKLFTLSATIPAAAAPSLAYWLARLPQPGRYEASEPRLVGAPRTPPALEAIVDAAIGGRTLRLSLPVVHAWTDRVYGERVRP